MENEIVTSIYDVLINIFQVMADQCIDMIATILPIAAPILAAIIVIGVGIRVFNQFTGESAARDLFIDNSELYDPYDWDELANEEVDWSNWEDHFS